LGIVSSGGKVVLRGITKTGDRMQKVEVRIQKPGFRGVDRRSAINNQQSTININNWEID